MADLFICTKDLASSISFKNLVAIPNITDKVAMKDAIQNFLNR
jgi:ascorbate PTS system EIIB component